MTKPGGWSRWGALSGVAFVVVFIIGVIGSSPPAVNASDQKWTDNYTGQSNQISHVLSGVCLVVAGLCLLAFLTLLWMRVADARRPASVNPLPLVAASVAAACMAVGGVSMAAISGSMIGGSPPPLPNADLLRFGDYFGFAMVGVAGMIATSLSIASLTVLARSAGVFGRGLTVFSLVVAVILLFSVLFLPILALMIWLVVLAVVMLRQPRGTAVEADFAPASTT